MKVRTAIYVIALLLVGVFVLANWRLLSQPAEINFLLTTASLPAGVVGLAGIGAALLITWGVHAVNRADWDRERRRLRNEIQQLRAQTTEAGRLAPAGTA